MRLSSVVASRPVLFFLVLAFMVLLLPGLMISFGNKMTEQLEHEIGLNAGNSLSRLMSEFEGIAKMLDPINSSATNLARALSSSLNGSDQLSFAEINTKVAPILFQAFSVIPYVSQVSYIGSDGLILSYYTDNNNQTLAVYSNSSSNASKARDNNTWFTQHVEKDTGKLYGEAAKTLSLINTSWFQEALNSSNGYASIGTGWRNGGHPLFLNTASIHGRGVVSLGFPIKVLTDFFTRINLNGGDLYLSTKDGKALVEGLPRTPLVLVDNTVSFDLSSLDGKQKQKVGKILCMPSTDTKRAYTLDIKNAKFQASCSTLDIVGVPLVYALVLPQDRLIGLVQKNSTFMFTLLGLIIGTAGISVSIFVFFMVRSAKREIHLCASLIKQKEATRQAERKSMNKSLAFASASHDIRNSLACITSLIELSYPEVAPGSELETNLKQMDYCTKDLMGLLNSILDTSKIEAGKMQLEEEEFNLAQLLEDVVDLYHPVGMKKGVEVVLDICDGSIMKFANVKADKGKLKQVLWNLLSNAVKFTSKGHVSVRAWVQKPSFQKKILACNQHGFLKCPPSFFYKSKDACSDLEAVNAARKYPKSMEFVFEVDDTGKGIPKEKQKSVFENYVQVKETALGQVGTGLGLGIVQSLVRLMGGEIGIVDKEIGEEGTCFRFNVFLTSRTADDTEIECAGNCVSCGTQHHLGFTNGTASTPSLMGTPCSRLHFRSSCIRLDGSHVVLLIKNKERRRISQKFMESLGINVSVVNRWDELLSTIRHIKSRRVSPLNSLRKSESSSRTDFFSSKDVPLSAMGGTDYKAVPFYRRRLSPGFILMVIDASAGPFSKLCQVVSEIREGISVTCCKVVWLNKPPGKINFEGLEDEILDSGDDIHFSRPFHGSRLLEVIKLLPEFGSTLGTLSVLNREAFVHGESFTNNSYIQADCLPNASGLQQTEILENNGSSTEKKRFLSPLAIDAHVKSNTRNSPAERRQYRQPEIQEEHPGLSSEQLLSGKRVLVAEDNPVLGKVAKTKLQQLRAIVELCKNGEEAVKLVCEGLRNQKQQRSSHILPYDYILMDCEMPTMNGYEATRRIREAEKHYGVHIPIIALTAHTSGEEARKTIQAGMDIHLGKPLQKEDLMKAIRYIHNK